MTTSDARFAETLKRQLDLRGYRVTIESNSASTSEKTGVRYYFASDAEDARKLATTLQSLGVPAPDLQPKLVSAPRNERPRHFDVVVARGALPSRPTAD